jgi:hypothetical protein
MGEADASLPGLKNADPFQFRKHGLEGKVIGALFALVFVLIGAIGIGGFKAVKLGEQIINSNKNVADAVRGVGVGLFELGQFVSGAGDLPRNPIQRPAGAPASPSEGSSQ